MISDTGRGSFSRSFVFLAVDTGPVKGLVTLDWVPKERVDCEREGVEVFPPLRRMGGIFFLFSLVCEV